jgi:hypothetical protein
VSNDGFLARWSRRKRSVTGRKGASAKPQPPAAVVGSETPAPTAEPPSLPPIESLDATSDITPFLAPGVPAELTRQALRQAWHADPAIRDFIGLSENSWDFTAPGGVPGFGPLTPEDIRRLVDAVTGKSEDVDPPPDAPQLDAEATPKPPDNAPQAVETPVVAPPDHPDRHTAATPVSARRHGGALPR